MTTSSVTSARNARRFANSLRLSAILLLATGTMAGAVQAQSATDLRENAVRQARLGKMAEAQASLRSLLVTGPDDGLVAMDLVTLLEQDGKPLEAAVIFTRAAKPDAPDYALQAAVRANQSVGNQEEARRLLAEGKRRFPSDGTWAALEKHPAPAVATPHGTR